MHHAQIVLEKIREHGLVLSDEVGATPRRETFLDRYARATIRGGSVDILCARAKHLGIIEAKDGEEAVAKPAELFNIPPERRNRITVADRTVMVVVD